MWGEYGVAGEQADFFVCLRARSEKLAFGSETPPQSAGHTVQPVDKNGNVAGGRYHHATVPTVQPMGRCRSPRHTLFTPLKKLRR